jgi:short-subunit dehydrogenase
MKEPMIKQINDRKHSRGYSVATDKMPPKMWAPSLHPPSIYIQEIYYRAWSLIGMGFSLASWGYGTFFDVLGFAVSLIMFPFYFCGYFENYAEKPVVLITGASRGFGELFAKKYAKERQARLLLSARNTEALETVARECRTLGATSAHVIKYDASKPDSGEALSTAMRQFGYANLDVLILNAGVTGKLCSIEDFSDSSEIDYAMNCNYSGYVRALLTLLPFLKMSVRPQVLVNSSLAGLIGGPQFPGYCGSKWAVNGFFKSVAGQVYKYGVQISIVYFGTTPSKAAVDHTTKYFNAGFEDIFYPQSLGRAVRYMSYEGFCGLPPRPKMCGEPDALDTYDWTKIDAANQRAQEEATSAGSNNAGQGVGV